MTGPAIPFGDPRWLLNRTTIMMPTRQDAAIVICGGGDPFAEAEHAFNLCLENDVPYTVFVGNDMIAAFGGPVDHALTLHPDKLRLWTSQRLSNGFPPPSHIWAHRPFSGVSDFTRDWAGSTGLFAVKVARELGFVHVLLCGVHMNPDSGHFVRKVRWDHCGHFIRAWEMRKASLSPYVRSYGGWTREQYGAPTKEWLLEEIEDKHREPAPPNWPLERRGQKA